MFILYDIAMNQFKTFLNKKNYVDNFHLCYMHEYFNT